jgi:acetylornithine deacetylase
MTSDSPLALLFASDEEGSESCCVARFVERFSGPRPRLTVVAEPTQVRAVLGHRGYLSVRGSFAGSAAHTSAPKRDRDSAVHRLVQWSSAALRTVDSIERQLGGDADLCFNIGLVSGGIKNNMVADRSELGWSARPPAGFDCRELLQRLTGLPEASEARWQTTFLGPSFSADPAAATAPERGGAGSRHEPLRDWLDRCRLPIAPDVDFWTEASLFSAAGWPAIVLGPGDIAQAHTAGEWVRIEQLHACREGYRQLLDCD